ncbi:MAG: acyl-CoA dehydrogenase family protein [Pseudomonadota bacterium]|jgi:alkylation response protein AidB-like acyl-CoA dehydrogenase
MRLTQEQIEFRDLFRRFLSEQVTSAYIRGRVNNPISFDSKLRTGFRELGLYDAFAGCDAGSPSSGLVELSLVAEESGRFLVPDASVEDVLVASLFESLLAPEDRAIFTAVLAPARTAIALAFPSCCHLTLDSSSGTVSGLVDWAVGGHSAEQLLCFAEGANGRRAVAVSVSNLPDEKKMVTSIDLTTPLTSYKVSNARSAVFSAESTEALEIAIETTKAAEITGVCRRVVEMTTEYVKTREQFGGPIGAFQAIQHKLAQMHAETESLASLCRFAAWSFAASPNQRKLTSRAAIIKAADLGPMVCEAAIQCHGGIGFTWEYDLHLYLRRALSVQSAFGISDGRAQELIDAAR